MVRITERTLLDGLTETSDMFTLSRLPGYKDPAKWAYRNVENSVCARERATCIEVRVIEYRTKWDEKYDMNGKCRIRRIGINAACDNHPAMESLRKGGAV